MKKYIYTLISLMTFTSLALAVPVLADNTTNVSLGAGASVGLGLGSGMMGGENGHGNGNRPMMKPGIFGTVMAVSGNTITVSAKQNFGRDKNGSGSATVTTFTVDATNATIIKNNTASTVASIVVGDTVMVQGTITGTNVLATIIRDGKMPMRGQGGKMGTPGQGFPNITGNGQPIVAGTVSAINGNTLTITNKSNVTYTVDATNAKITGGPNVTSISNVAVGDMVIVQGAVNGNAVVATSVIDQAKPVSVSNTTNTSGESEQPHKGGGFFGGVGSFFVHLFGF